MIETLRNVFLGMLVVLVSNYLIDAAYPAYPARPAITPGPLMAACDMPATRDANGHAGGATLESDDKALLDFLAEGEHGSESFTSAGTPASAAIATNGSTHENGLRATAPAAAETTDFGKSTPYTMI